MPRFKSKGTLERTALADLWKHTLSQIPTVYGRLAYLASLRDSNSGVYRHHGLSAAFGREESGKALKQSHDGVFSEWLNLALAEKSRDLRTYLQGLDDPQGIVVGHWLRSEHYRAQIPDSARPMEIELFHRDLEALLQILRNAGPAEPPGPGSGQSS
jgi:hypothetical protein